MVNILRVRARWEGFSGAPGYSVLHFRDFSSGEGPGADPTTAQAQSATDRVRSFIGPMLDILPSSVKITMDSVVDVLEDTTGTMIDSLSVTPGPVLSGTSAAPYSAASGAVVTWNTGSIRNGRRIRGRTFLVPLASGAFDSTGTLSPGALTLIQDSANLLVAATGTPDLGVYARPTGPGAADGRWVIATSARVPDMGAILSSRRD